jgi:hypothetical protein
VSTRQLYGGSLSDWVYVNNEGITETPPAPVVVTFWSDADSSNTQITDLTDTFGNPITSVTSDDFGQIPQFYGPAAGNTYMYADANNGSGPRSVIDSYGQKDFTNHLASAFVSGTGTAAQTVTGMAVTLPSGIFLIRGRFWYTGAGTVGSTQTFAFTFGGTTSDARITWQFKAAAYTAPVSGTALTTGSGASPTLTSTTYAIDVEAYAVVTAAGTLQLTVQSTVSGDEVSVLSGSYLNVEPIAA